MLRRRTAQTDTAASTTVEAPPSPTVGKGRPTPKRRDAEQARRTPVIAPRNSKEARAQQRAQMREVRAGRMRGDERYLTGRDRGPVRGFARDYVDSRRNMGGAFIPSAVVILVLNSIPAFAAIGFYLMIALILAITVDSVLLSRRVKAEVARRFPGENAHGVGAYTVMRALQIRKLRIPPPRVKRGEPI